MANEGWGANKCKDALQTFHKVNVPWIFNIFSHSLFRTIRLGKRRFTDSVSFHCLQISMDWHRRRCLVWHKMEQNDVSCSLLIERGIAKSRTGRRPRPGIINREIDPKLKTSKNWQTFSETFYLRVFLLQPMDALINRK